MDSYQLGNYLLKHPKSEITASTDVSNKAFDDLYGKRVFSSDLCECVYDKSRNEHTLTFGLHDFNYEQSLINESFSFFIEVISDNLYDQTSKSHLAEVMSHISDGFPITKPYLIDFLKSIKNESLLKNYKLLNNWIKQTIKRK